MSMLIALDEKPRYRTTLGDPKAKIVCVLDFMSGYDVKEGKLLSGPPGNVLDLALQNAMMLKSEMYFMTLFKEPCTIQTARKFYYEKGVKKAATGYFTVAGRQYADQLLNELRQLEPNVIVAIGPASINLLTRKTGQLKHRGSFYTCPHEGIKAKIFCTMLPHIACAGNKKTKDALEGRKAVSPYVYRYYIANDFKKLKRHADTRHILSPPRKLIVNSSFREVISFLDAHPMQRAKRIAVDIETLNYQVACLGIAVSSSLAISIPFDKRYSIAEEAALWIRLGRLFADEKLTKIYQNQTFDVWFLALQNKLLHRGRLEDTMLAHHIMFPDMHADLGFLTSVYTDEPYYKDEGKIWEQKTISQIDLLAFWRYNAKDAACTYEIWSKIEKEIDQGGYRETYEQTIALCRPLIFWEYRGLAVNENNLQEKKVEVADEIRKKSAELVQLAGQELNANSPKQLQAYFYGKLGIQPYYNTIRTPNGVESRVTTDDRAMARLARGTASRKPIPEARLVQTIRSLRKLSGTYLEVRFDADRRLRCATHPRGTTAGRISTSTTIPFGTGTNLQNLPPAFKSFIVPDAGYFFIEIDKRQAEWVAVAYIFNDPAMQMVIEQGLDPHSATACMMLRLDPSYIPLIKLEDKTLGHTSDAEEISYYRKHAPPELQELYNQCKTRFLPRTMSIRQCGKKSNHGLNYDETFKMFAMINEIQEKEARNIVESYHQIYPMIRTGHKEIQQQLAQSRSLVNPYGRKRHFRDRWGTDMFKEAYAFLPQSTVADCVNRAIIKAYENKEKLWYLDKNVFCGQVHDSVLLQHPIDDLEGAALATIKWIEYLNEPIEYRGRVFSIESDVKISSLNWTDMAEVEMSGNIVEKFQQILDQQEKCGD